MKSTNENRGMAIFKRRHKATQITSTAEFEQLLSEGKPVLVDFMKHNCGPCQTMDGIVNEVSEEFVDDAIVVKANLEKVPDLFGKFKVKSTPTFVLLAPKGNGLHQRWRHSGLVKKDVMVNNVQRAVEAV
jgi:thioredoxin 1